MNFNVESKFYLEKFNINYVCCLCHSKLDIDSIELPLNINSSLRIYTTKSVNSLNLYTFIEEILNKLSKGIDAPKINEIIKEGTLTHPNGKKTDLLKIDYILEDIEKPPPPSIFQFSHLIYDFFKEGFKYLLKDITLETIKKESCIWKIGEASIYLKDKNLLSSKENLKVETSKDADFFSLNSFLNKLKLYDYLKLLKLKEVSIIDKDNVGITKEDHTFHLCNINKKYINMFNETEKTLYTTLVVLAGKMNIKKAEESDN